jgi:hypothetical protein
VINTLGAPPPLRRRRRPRPEEPGASPAPLPLTQVTAVRAFEPLSDPAAAQRWLERAVAAEEEADAIVAVGIELLNHALHARAVAAADPRAHELAPERAAAVRIGFGSGAELADGNFTAAEAIDVRAGAASRRRRRQEDLRPQERVAAVLGGRERLDASETLLLRARADLDAGRLREAALQLRVGLEALLVELRGALDDADHEADLAALGERRGEAGAAANAALSGALGADQVQQVRELLELCERVLRRRRILGE